jgi:hypothetical protein
MRGSYPATRDHKIVPLNHSSARLDSSTTLLRQYGSSPIRREGRGRGGKVPHSGVDSGGTYISPSSSGITSTRFLQKTRTLERAFSHIKGSQKAYARPTRTIRSRSRNSSVQNSLSFDQASSRSKSRPFFLNYFSTPRRDRESV